MSNPNSSDSPPPSPGQPEGIYGRYAAFVLAHARLVTAGLALVTLVAGLLATNIGVNPNLIELLPEGHPTTMAIEQIANEEGGTNLVTISVTGTDDDETDAWCEEFVERLEARDDVDFALYELDPEVAWRLGLLQLTPSELTTIRDRLRASLALGPAASNPIVAGRLLDLGPLTAKLSSGAEQTSLTSASGARRILVRPTGSAYDPTFARPFMNDLYGLIDELEPESVGVEVPWVGGAYRHTVEDLEAVVSDLGWTAVASFTFVLTLIAVAFRDPRAVLLIFVPLAISTTWTAGYVWLTVETLNTFTSYFVAVLIGLGVDFAVHLYSRYREEKGFGRDVESAIISAWDHSGPPCGAAAMTSAGGFLALWAAGFQGFQQLGTILAGGILFCLVSVLTTLPLLIRWRESHRRTIPLRKVKPPPEDQASPTYKLAPLGLFSALAFTVMGLTLFPQIGFEYDMSELRPAGKSYADLDEDRRAYAEDSYAPVVVSYEDAEELKADHLRMTAALEDGKLKRIGGVVSIYTLLPPDQDERLAGLAEVAELSRDPNMVYLPAQVRMNLARIAETTPTPMTPEDLPRGLRHVMGANEGRHRMLLMPQGNMWDLRENSKLYKEVERWLPEPVKASEYFATAMVYRLVAGDAPRVAGIALIVVFLFSAFDLRSIRRGLAAVLTLAAGMAWAGAGMALFRVELSMVNFVAIPILMGIGVDVIIHLLHRLWQEGPGRIRYALQTTGWAAGLSAATTVCSFASLSFASSQGVQGMGLLIVMGLTLVTTAAFIFLPLGWMLNWKLTGELED